MTTLPAPAAPITLADVRNAPRITEHPRHSHCLDDIVGYVLRVTINSDGVRLEQPDGRIGHDVALISDPTEYSTAVNEANRIRRIGRAYAVVDNIYACGCRS